MIASFMEDAGYDRIEKVSIFTAKIKCESDNRSKKGNDESDDDQLLRVKRKESRCQIAD